MARRSAGTGKTSKDGPAKTPEQPATGSGKEPVKANNTKEKDDGPAKQPGPTEGVPAPPSSPVEKLEWIVTTDKASGQVVKVERLDLGQRHELSVEEYASLAASAPLALAAADVGGLPDPSSAYYEGYSQGINDAWGLLAANYGYSPEEQAYYLGMMHFAASFHR